MGGHLVQWSGTILAILVQVHSRNISILFGNWAIGLGRAVVKKMFYLLLWQPFCSVERNISIIFKPLAKEEMLFKGFSFFSFSSHCVQLS